MIGGIRYGCRELAPKYSQFVDGALRGHLVEMIERHLLTCDACIAEVRQLRGVQSMLRAADQQSAEGDDTALQSRLVSIAGDQAAVPLALRPGSGRLPTRARSMKRAAAAGVLFTLAAVFAWASVGLVAAPPVIGVADLGAEARAEFTAALTRLPLENPAVVAALASKNGASTFVGAVQQVAAVSRESRLPQPSALLTLAAVSREASYGVQRVFLRAGSGFASVDVETTWTAGGAFVAVHGPEDKVVLQGFLPRSSKVTDPDWTSGDYDLDGWAGASTIAGVRCDVVEASLGGRVVARWRIDPQTGLVLWEERFGTDGALTLSAGYVSVVRGAIEPASGSELVLIEGRGSDVTSATSCDRGWVCLRQLRGLPLVWRAVDRLADPTRMTAVYSDGMTTITLLQRKGAVTDPPPELPAGQDSYEADGMPALVAWQSGEWMLSVSTNGGLALARAAATDLPHEPVHGPDLLGRILAGWARITSVR